MKGLQSRINVTPEKLDTLLCIAFGNKYLNFIFDNYPYDVCTTNKGLAWAAPVDGEVLL